MNGSNAADKILVYNLASIIPENMTTSVAPHVDILPNKNFYWMLWLWSVSLWLPFFVIRLSMSRL